MVMRTAYHTPEVTNNDGDVVRIPHFGVLVRSDVNNDVTLMQIIEQKRFFSHRQFGSIYHRRFESSSQITAIIQ
jgi:hypothetical protein